jgi:hypothetical protein
MRRSRSSGAHTLRKSADRASTLFFDLEWGGMRDHQY